MSNTIYIDKLKQLSTVRIMVFVTDAYLQHLSLEGL